MTAVALPISPEFSPPLPDPADEPMKEISPVEAVPEGAEFIKLPGLIDMHVHLREPGATHKETFATGTLAAIHGGITTVFDMPNNPDPYRVTSFNEVVRKRAYAQRQVYSDLGIYYESKPELDNVGSFEIVKPLVHGLKLYLEPTTGNTTEYDPGDFAHIMESWAKVADPTQPIVLHAEGRTINEAFARVIGGEARHNVHVAHVSNKEELEAIIAAREAAQNVGVQLTCGVCPHHLFLTQFDTQPEQLGWKARMKPPLGTQQDQDFLWAHLDDIDVFETDHAPHTIQEKQKADLDNPEADPSKLTCYGVPGLEAMLPLLLQAVDDGKLTMDQLVNKLHTRPAQILGLQPDPRNKIWVAKTQYEFGPEHVRSKSGWSPYIGRVVTGQVVRVEMHGRIIINGGRLVDETPRGELLVHRV